MAARFDALNGDGTTFADSVPAIEDGRPVTVPAWELADALYDLGRVAESKDVDRPTAPAAYRVEADGTYHPAS
jgi:hypothetical protein